MDTIFALASARGKAGVAVLRISGPDAVATVRSMVDTLPTYRQAGVRELRGQDGLVLDQALILVFRAPNSFTGEDVVELHLHGSTATVNAVLSDLSTRPGLRLAEPGEFTRRALENDRLDLAQVEGLSDLIEAETEAQRRQSMRLLSGELGNRAEGWRTALIRAASLLEATIDFVDEDVPVDVGPEVHALLEGVKTQLKRESAGVAVAERIREGFEVAIVGPPNVGKSTLLNALAGREAAITSEVAGTTRDVIEVRMDLRGLPVTILDTAGLRETSDHVESIGVDRAIARANAADIRVFLKADHTIFSGVDVQDHDISVFGKADLGLHAGESVSGKTGVGVQALVDRVADELASRSAGAATATHVRHRVAIDRAIGALESAAVELKSGPDRVELAAEQLRSGIRALDSLVGRVDVEHILDEIFSSFCIGK